MARIAAPLGADVPACVYSQTASGEGVGQVLEMLPNGKLEGTFVLLVNPLHALSTAKVFKAWDGCDRGPLNMLDTHDALINGRNDLQEPAIREVPAISEVIQTLNSTQPIASKMSGSGATCFAIYNDKQSAESAEKSSSHGYLISGLRLVH